MTSTSTNAKGDAPPPECAASISTNDSKSTNSDHSTQAEKSPRIPTIAAIAEGAGVVDYYDAPTGKYLVCNHAGRWLPLVETAFKRQLKARGIKTKVEEGQSLSEADALILDVQNHRDIAYYGRLCGRDSGLVSENGNRFLVTEDMDLPEPAKGSWRTIEAVIEGLLCESETPDIAAAQRHTIYGWIRSSVEALRNRRYQQQQALAICGVGGCGKSLLQHLITEMLAGREAKAARYLQGRTDFNADLFQAEHLVLEDDHCSSRISDRLKLGASLKEICVGSTSASLHAKRRDAINITPWWRVTITLNDDPEAMMVLPPLDEHIADKITLLRASTFDFPMPTFNSEEKLKFRKQLSLEIPAFVHWLLSEYVIPDQFADPRRYVIKTFHHPELRESLEQLSPEADLLELIDRAFAGSWISSIQIEVTAEEVEETVSKYDSRRAERLFNFRNAAGTYLGRIAKRHPERIEPRRTGTSRHWIISQPTDRAKM